MADGTLPDFQNFSKETEKKRRKRKAKYKREANEAKRMKLSGDDSSETHLS